MDELTPYIMAFFCLLTIFYLKSLWSDMKNLLLLSFYSYGYLFPSLYFEPVYVLW